MMRIPPQHNIKNPPGQSTNPIDMNIPKKLGDVIDKIKKEEEIFLNGKKKLSFDEWLDIEFPYMKEQEFLYNLVKVVWKAGQENK